MDPLTLAELAALGIAGYEVAAHTGLVGAKPPGATQYSPSNGATTGQKIAGVGGATPATPPPEPMRNARLLSRVLRQASPATAVQIIPCGNNFGANGSGDPNIQQKLDAAQAAIKAKFDQASQAEKDAAAAQLNAQLKLDPPVTGSDTYEKVAAAVGTAAGAAAGAYLCGPLCGKVGALLGAYCATKLEEWCSKNMDEIEDWVKSNIGDNIEDAANAIGDAAEDAYDTVGGWF